MIFQVVAGVKAEDIDAVADSLAVLLGSSYERRSSLYFGEYNVFSCPETLVVKYNFVESEGEWDEPDYQHLHVLVRAGETERPEFFRSLVARLQLETEVVRYREWDAAT
jgi:hypothetical protein